MTATTKALTTSLLVPAVLLASGCFGATSTPGATTLRIAFGPDDGSPGLVVFHLSCNPPGGTVPDASAARAALRNLPALMTAPSGRFPCRGVVGAWAVSVACTVGGRRVDRRLGVCDQQATGGVPVGR